MDTQSDARFSGFGLAFEQLASAIGAFRQLAQQQAVQLQAKDQKISELEAEIARLKADQPRPA